MARLIHGGSYHMRRVHVSFDGRLRYYGELVDMEFQRSAIVRLDGLQALDEHRNCGLRLVCNEHKLASGTWPSSGTYYWSKALIC